MATHSVPHEGDDLEFIDVSQEEYRTYFLPNGNRFVVPNPVALCVKPSGSHRVLAQREDGKYVSVYIPSEGNRPLEWVVESGAYFFNGWGPTAIENTGIVRQP